MKHITCIEDLRELHKRKVPKAFFDYADRGSYSEDTLRANRDDLQAIKFRQRILVDVSKRDLSTTILGEPAALPLILAPIGLTGMQYGDGEIHACRAAQAAGIPYTLSTMPTSRTAWRCRRNGRCRSSSISPPSPAGSPACCAASAAPSAISPATSR